jgi:hypothetical protein
MLAMLTAEQARRVNLIEVRASDADGAYRHHVSPPTHTELLFLQDTPAG